MKALVLSGGEIRGAYQAGALHALTDRQWTPDIITGTSVGALNALLLADQVWRGVPWPVAASALMTFWLERVTGPATLSRKRSVWAMGLDLFRNRWGGVYDMRPLWKLAQEAVPALPGRPEGGMQVLVATTDLSAGTVSHWPLTAIEQALASAMIPGVMPGVSLAGAMHYDGGVREIAPLKAAIDAGATEIVVVTPTPEKLKYQAVGTLPSILSRTLAVLASEILENDLRIFHNVNRDVALGQAPPDKRLIGLTVVRPYLSFPFDLQRFTPEDIRAMVNHGYADAGAALAGDSLL